MKKLFLFIAILLFAIQGFSQSKLKRDIMEAKQTLIVNGYSIEGISNDSIIAVADSLQLVTQYAMKKYIDANGGGGFIPDGVTILPDGTLDTINYVATKTDLLNVSVDTVNEISTKYDITKQLKYFSNIAAISTTLELGERIKIEDNGAVYFIQNTTVAGYNGGLADGVAVIDLGGSKYAVLQPNGDEINMSWFTGTDYEKLDTASLYCSSNDAYNYVLIDYDTITLDDHSLPLRKGCIITGTNGTGGTLNGIGGTVIISDFNDITKPTFVTDSLYVASYHSFTGIKDLKIEAVSNALCGIRLINPERNVIENIEINGNATNRYFKDGFIMSGSIHQSIKGLTILGCAEVAFHTVYYNLIGTTTNLDDCWFKASNIGMKLDSNSMNLVLKENTIELIDSSSIIAENNGITVSGKLHIEDASQNGNSNVIQLGLMNPTGAITNSSYFDGLRLSQNPSNTAAMIYADKVSTLSFMNAIFRSGLTTLDVTDNINSISFENCIERGVTNTAYDFVGMPTDSTKITMINCTEGVTSPPKTFFGSSEFGTGNLLLSGTGDYISKYNSTGDNIEDSEIYQLGAKIGIGLTDPVSLLQFYEPTGAEVGIRFGNVTTGKTASDGAYFGIDGGEDLVIINEEANRLSLGTSGLSRVVITSGGNVGFGTGNANYNTQIFKAGSAAILSQFTNGTTGANSADGFLVGIDSGENGYLWNQENNDIIFGVNNLEKVRVFSDGTLRFSDYGSGTVTGTATRYLAVELDGDVIEVDAPTSDNLYNTDGTLTANRTITSTGQSLTYSAIDGNDINVTTFADNGIDFGLTDTGTGAIGSYSFKPEHFKSTSAPVIIVSDVSDQLIISDNETDATTKNATVSGGHYTNSEEPLTFLYSQSSSAANSIRFGGGTSSGNAATVLDFHTAANNTTVTGTRRVRIDSEGRTSFGLFSTPTAVVNIKGTGTASSTSSFEISDSANATKFEIKDNGEVVIYSDMVIDDANNVRIVSGSGSPESVVTAGIGSTYHRTDGSTGTSFYVKESGTGSTGWIAK